MKGVENAARRMAALQNALGKEFPRLATNMRSALRLEAEDPLWVEGQLAGQLRATATISAPTSHIIPSD